MLIMILMTLLCRVKAVWHAPCNITGRGKWTLSAQNEYVCGVCPIISNKSFLGNLFTKHFHIYYFKS